jgi:hypothetical protein
MNRLKKHLGHLQRIHRVVAGAAMVLPAVQSRLQSQKRHQADQIHLVGWLEVVQKQLGLEHLQTEQVPEKYFQNRQMQMGLPTGRYWQKARLVQEHFQRVGHLELRMVLLAREWNQIPTTPHLA